MNNKMCVVLYKNDNKFQRSNLYSQHLSMTTTRIKNKRIIMLVSEYK